MLGRSMLLLPALQPSLPRFMCKKVPTQPVDKDKQRHTRVRKGAFTAKDLFDQLTGPPSPKKYVPIIILQRRLINTPLETDSTELSSTITDKPRKISKIVLPLYLIQDERANPSQTATVEPGSIPLIRLTPLQAPEPAHNFPKPLDLHLFTGMEISKHSWFKTYFKNIVLDYDQLNHPTSRCPVFDAINELEISLMCSSSPLNQFEEWLQWTAEGKMWKFPIDNEQDWEEQQVPFHEHVFLKKHVDQRLLNCRPLATFMDLVCHGLAQNPHFTVEQKLEHLRWCLTADAQTSSRPTVECLSNFRNPIRTATS
ncbi:unnamed protein product [Dicrocoelium dendriticum]|nr:unnamed protein product [Dicrocoelium dendriticum]